MFPGTGRPLHSTRLPLMHEDLLGYLLGALEPHEMRRVAQLLQEDPEARAQLEEIERSLKPLEDAYEVVEPPPADLVSRTLDSLPPLPSPDDVQADEEVPAVELVPMQTAIESPKSRAATWFDWVAGATAAAVILGLLLPSLAQGRFESRKVACKDQLRQVGTAITQFVTRNHQERLPAVSETGPEAFAGVYAVRLNDAGLINDPSIRWCPSLDPPSSDNATLTGLNDLVTVDELHQANVDVLRQIQQYSGGHYAYTLGVIEQDKLAPPRFEARSSFAIMSDAPLSGSPNRDQLVTRVGHSGTGINVLYEDGRVRFIPVAALDLMPDHPLFNHRGDVEAGVNSDDASLAPSWRPPFVEVRQR